MIVIVIGGILAGVFTPTESAAIAVVYCLVLGFIYKAIKVKDLPGILLIATQTTAIVMLLVGVSTVMAWRHVLLAHPGRDLVRACWA